MGVITFLLRFTPLLFIKKSNTEPIRNRNWILANMPLAVLSALTIPGIFQVDDTTPLVGLAAGLMAVLLSLIKKMPLFAVIFLSVLAAAIVKSMM
ncbi:AzlD domain-containing protein [Paenibacillaceae bacterium]|nr:AzlD domain-containing protein [Paenibacillaceae bacterium]